MEPKPIIDKDLLDTLLFTFARYASVEDLQQAITPPTEEPPDNAVEQN